MSPSTLSLWFIGPVTALGILCILSNFLITSPYITVLATFQSSIIDTTHDLGGINHTNKTYEDGLTVSFSDLEEDALSCKCQEENMLFPWECQSNHEPSNQTVVAHCRSNGRGLFLIRDPVPVNHTHPPLMHVGALVRINGVDIDTILFTWNYTYKAWTAEYQICRAGNYTGAVYIYMKSIPDVGAVLRREACMDDRFNRPFMFDWIETESASACNNMWFWNDRQSGDNAAELSLLSPCPPRPDYIEAYQDLRNTIPNIDWVFEETKRRANDSRLICIYGDSQLRNLANTIIYLINAAACDPIEMQIGRANCAYPGFLWEAFHFESDWHFDHQIDGCSHVFINYGQWPASWVLPTPWSIAEYEESVNRFANKLASIKSNIPQTKIYFLSTNIGAFMDRLTSCPVADFRFPHIIEAYNNVARKAFLKIQNLVGFLDTFRVIRPVFDLSMDCCHYQGMVGVALANLVGNCFYHDMC